MAFNNPKRVKRCELSKNKVAFIDYKDIKLLRKYITDKGKIIPSRATGLCASYQRKVTAAIKKARHVALLPFTNN